MHVSLTVGRKSGAKRGFYTKFRASSFTKSNCSGTEDQLYEVLYFRSASRRLLRKVQHLRCTRTTLLKMHTKKTRRVSIAMDTQFSMNHFLSPPAESKPASQALSHASTLYQPSFVLQSDSMPVPHSDNLKVDGQAEPIIQRHRLRLHEPLPTIFPLFHAPWNGPELQLLREYMRNSVPPSATCGLRRLPAEIDVSILEIQATADAPISCIKPFHTTDMLKLHLLTQPMCNVLGRVILVHDLAPGAIDVLGQRYGLSPFFFQKHLRPLDTGNAAQEVLSRHLRKSDKSWRIHFPNVKTIGKSDAVKTEAMVQRERISVQLAKGENDGKWLYVMEERISVVEVEAEVPTFVFLCDKSSARRTSRDRLFSLMASFPEFQRNGEAFDAKNYLDQSIWNWMLDRAATQWYGFLRSKGKCLLILFRSTYFFTADTGPPEDQSDILSNYFDERRVLRMLRDMLTSSISELQQPSNFQDPVATKQITTDYSTLLETTEKLHSELEQNLLSASSFVALKESRSLRTFSKMAVMFLPLSLAAQLLSVQSPAYVLRHIYPDFFALSVLIMWVLMA
jgi:hypothetical protein